MVQIVRVYSGDRRRVPLRGRQPPRSSPRSSTRWARAPSTSTPGPPAPSPTTTTPLGSSTSSTWPGTAEFEVADGSKARLSPGDVLIAEDITGHGHIARSIGDDFRISLAVPLANQTRKG